MPLVILHHLLNVFVQLANKRGFTNKKQKKMLKNMAYFHISSFLTWELIIISFWIHSKGAHCLEEAAVKEKVGEKCKFNCQMEKCSKERT
jgi:hypothetical protein